MRKHLCITLLLSLAACKPHPAPPPAAKLPFDIAPQTTAITAPLRPDGTPDYAAALNQKYGAGVTPQNNGFLLILQAFGTDGIKPKYRGELLAACGSAECPPAGPAWEDFGQYLRRLDPDGGKDIPYEKLLEDEAVSKTAWVRSQHPKVADYLDAHAAQFDLIARGVRMPHFWEPIPPTAPNWYQPASKINSNLSASTYSLRLRALLRLGGGDFEGFLADAETLKRTARCLSAGPALINKVMALSIENSANQMLALALATGKLTAAQCDPIQSLLAAFGPMTPLTNAWTEYERWQTLHIVLRIAMGDKAALQESKSPDAWLTIEPARVDWNQVLTTSNAYFDDPPRNEFLSASELRAKADQDLERSAKLMGQFLNQALTSKDPQPLQLDPIGSMPGTTREQYTQHVIDSLRQLLLIDVRASAELLHRECQLRQSLLPPLLALARLRATAGAWPKTFQDIPPEIRNTFPADPFAEGNAPIQYSLSPAGPTLFSVGHDGKPNQPNAGTHDDIGLGADTSLR